MFANGKPAPSGSGGSDRDLDGRFLLGWGALAATTVIAVIAVVFNPPAPANKVRMALRPDDGPLYTGSITPSNATVGVMKPSDARDLATGSTMNRLAGDVSALRQTIDTLRRQNEMMVARLDALEQKNVSSSASSSPDKASSTGSATESGAPMSAKAFIDGDTLATGSTKLLDRASGPATPSPHPVPQSFGIDLGDFADRQTLRANWMFYRTRASTQLSRLSAVVQASEKGGFSQFKLIAGPFEHLQDATMVCGRISTQGIACSSVAYEGTPLEQK